MLRTLPAGCLHILHRNLTVSPNSPEETLSDALTSRCDDVEANVYEVLGHEGGLLPEV